MKKNGYLVLIGGAEKRSGKMTVLRKTIELNNAQTVVVIPTASSYPRDVGKSYYYIFRDLGAKDVYIFDIRSREEAAKKEYLEKIEDAGLIFFTGGDQVKLVEKIHHTKLFEKIKKKLLQGATVAGTSAGAAAAGDPLIYYGDYKGFKKGVVRYSEGFGFLKNITIDTHFTKKNRIYRLSQFLLSGLSNRGIGIGEDTGIIISPDNKCEVVGSGMVTLLNSKKVTYSNYKDIYNYDPVTANGINLGFLHTGAVFNLQYWNVDNENTVSNSCCRYEYN